MQWQSYKALIVSYVFQHSKFGAQELQNKSRKWVICPATQADINKVLSEVGVNNFCQRVPNQLLLSGARSQKLEIFREPVHLRIWISWNYK